MPGQSHYDSNSGFGHCLESEMTQTVNPGPAKYAAAKAYNAFNLATFTIGTKSGNTINVAVQLQTARGQSVAQICQVMVYLSANADGSTLSGTATTSALAIGTNGVLLDITTTGLVCDVISNSSGQFDLNIIQTASPTTYYMVVCAPDGSIIVSGAVTF
jgi:hypothetical protein